MCMYSVYGRKLFAVWGVCSTTWRAPVHSACERHCRNGAAALPERRSGGRPGGGGGGGEGLNLKEKTYNRIMN
jgi:hypothetical protein